MPNLLLVSNNLGDILAVKNAFRKFQLLHQTHLELFTLEEFNPEITIPEQEDAYLKAKLTWNSLLQDFKTPCLSFELKNEGQDYNLKLCIFLGFAEPDIQNKNQNFFYNYKPNNQNFISSKQNLSEVVFETSAKLSLNYTQKEFQECLEQSLFNLFISLPFGEIKVIGKYDFGMNTRPRSLGIIRAKTSGKYLAFVKNYGGSKGKLAWVGGGVDFMEIPKKALIREIQEELGFTDFRIVRTLGDEIIHYFDGIDYKVCSVTFGFEIEIDNFEAKIPAEIDDGRYTLIEVSKEEFMKKSDMEIAKKFLERI